MFLATTCAACAKPLAHDAPRCVRCWTRYCDASCQLEHWSSGHKKQCKKIARGGGAEQFYADAKYKEAAEAAVAGCRPDIPADAICYICRDDASREGLVSGCGCHDGAGIAHLTCLARQGRMSVKDEEESSGYGQGILKWAICFECNQQYYGVVKVALGWACWKTYLGRPETDWSRCLALAALGAALMKCEPETALSALEEELALLRRFWPFEERNVLAAQANSATALAALGLHDEALRLRRELYTAGVEKLGEGHEASIINGRNLTRSLIASGLVDEAKQFAREQLGIARRSLGERHPQTSWVAANLAEALVPGIATPAEALEAEELLAEVVAVRQRVLGPRHPNTLGAVRNLDGLRRQIQSGPVFILTPPPRGVRPPPRARAEPGSPPPPPRTSPPRSGARGSSTFAIARAYPWLVVGVAAWLFVVVVVPVALSLID